MILAHNSTQYLNFKIFAGLANKITYSLGKVTLQNMKTSSPIRNDIQFYTWYGCLFDIPYQRV